MRALFVVLVAGLALAPAALAKSGWEVQQDLQDLEAGKQTDIVLTAIDHEDGGPTSRFEGLKPELAFEDLTTGDKYRVTGSPANRRGRSVVPVVIPHDGLWATTIRVNGRLEGGFDPVNIEAPAKPAAVTPPKQGDDGGPPVGLLILGGVLLAAAASAALMRLRRPRMGGA